MLSNHTRTKLFISNRKIVESHKMFENNPRVKAETPSEMFKNVSK